MLTTKLLILLVGGGAVIGAVSTRIASDVISGTAVAGPTRPCTVLYIPEQPQRPREAPVGLGNWSGLFKGKH